MKIYTVQIYKILDNGETEEKGLLMGLDNFPAIFATTTLACKVATIAVKALNENMYSNWDFRLVEGETL